MGAMELDTEAVGAALGNRLRGVAGALERLDRFAFGPGTERMQPAEPGLPGGRELEAAQIFVLRAIRALSDPVGWQVLQLLRDAQRSSADLAAALGCPRVAAWEAVNDLVQAGLATRGGDADRAELTAAGAGLVSFIEELAGAAAAVARR